MRELQLYREFLVKEQERHLKAAQHIASASLSPHDHGAIVAEAKAAELIRRLILDLDSLEADTGEFVKRFLNG